MFAESEKMTFIEDVKRKAQRNRWAFSLIVYLRRISSSLIRNIDKTTHSSSSKLVVAHVLGLGQSLGIVPRVHFLHNKHS
ncbi:MAG: hypothetical protein R2827_12255 [Bdellovibrionales bacterium]